MSARQRRGRGPELFCACFNSGRDDVVFGFEVRRNFIDLLTPAELDVLAALNERVLRHLAKDDDSPAEDEPS